MKILIAEDDLVSSRLLEATLVRYGYEVAVATDGAAAGQLLQEGEAPRLAILDWMMPGMDGIQVCREIRQRADRPYIYLILLTAKDRKQDVIEGLEAGADDYLVKPFDAHELQARLKAGQRILDLQDQLIAAQESLREQAMRDALTGLWNRRAILEILEHELARSRRLSVPLGVIMADLDYFKQINDTRGHLVGDAVLQEVSRRMRLCLRSYDTIGRYGGEEFLIVLPDCDGLSTVTLAERLRSTMGDPEIVLEGGPLALSMSLGVSVSTAVVGEDTYSLLNAADSALYMAKNSGRNRVHYNGLVAEITASRMEKKF